jgi:hypothetical protein
LVEQAQDALRSLKADTFSQRVAWIDRAISKLEQAKEEINR